jgi:diaminopimelate decarboxylase
MRLGTQRVNAQGHLEIGGCDALALAEAYGTPLYVLDEDALRARCRDYKDAFAPLKPDVQIAYAAKAALNRALCQIIADEGLGLDVASGGELYTALQAGFPPARIHCTASTRPTTSCRWRSKQASAQSCWTTSRR